MKRHLPILAVAFLTVAGLRMLAPVDLFQGDQEKQVGYVMDILHGGRLAIQYEVNGRIATKPPLYNWCAVACCLAARRTDPWVMKLPALFAGAGAVLLTYLLACRFFDPETAFWGALTMLSAHHVQKLLWFARTDMLLAFTVLLAIYLSIVLRSPWWRSLAVGTVLGASFLTKGPVGPALYGLWLAVWAWRRGAWRDGRQWLWLLPGACVLALIAGAWLTSVWQEPQFRETVLRGEVADRLAAGGRRSRPFWYYVPLLFGRIAPWPLVAAGAVLAAWRRRDERWRDVLCVLAWFAVLFLFFSAIPAKRHDLLLPVYPPVFLLAGLGLRDLAAPQGRRWLTLLVWGLAVAAAAGAAVLAARNSGGFRFVALGTGVAASGVAAIGLLAAHRRAALALALGSLAVMVAAESWLETPETLAYRRLTEFVSPIRAAARAGAVAVWEAHPLVSYVLGLHQRRLDLATVLRNGRRAPSWVVAGRPLPQDPPWAAAASLNPQARLCIEGQGVDVTLYRVSRKEPPALP